MNHQPLGLTGVKVSELCLGTMNFGHPTFGVGEEDSLAVINAYLDAGGNFIDTADAYGGGESERIVAKAVKGRRDQVIIATKGFFPRTPNFGELAEHVNAMGSSRRHLSLAVEDSLRRLETDYIDLYQVHLWDELTPIEETLSTLTNFVRQGKVCYVGLSNYTAWQIAEARQLCKQHGWEPFVTAQMQYSLACRHIEHDIVPVCLRYGIGLLPWSPLAMGVLTGKYPRGTTAMADARFKQEAANDAEARWRAQFFNDKSWGHRRCAARAGQGDGQYSGDAGHRLAADPAGGLQRDHRAQDGNPTQGQSGRQQGEIHPSAAGPARSGQRGGPAVPRDDDHPSPRGSRATVNRWRLGGEVTPAC